MTGAAHGQTIPDRVVQHEFFEIQLRSDDIVWLIRRSIPYRDLTGLHDAYDALLATVDDWLLERRIARGMLGTRKRTHMAWLFDVRAVSSHRNDDDFEKAVQRRQPHLIERSPFRIRDFVYIHGGRSAAPKSPRRKHSRGLAAC